MLYNNTMSSDDHELWDELCSLENQPQAEFDPTLSHDALGRELDKLYREKIKLTRENADLRHQLDVQLPHIRSEQRLKALAAMGNISLGFSFTGVGAIYAGIYAEDITGNSYPQPIYGGAGMALTGLAMYAYTWAHSRYVEKRRKG